jgi:hypothetical protein
MVLDRIFKIGEMLGLEYGDIQNLLSDRQTKDIKNVIPCSPMNTYKENGTWYGTISINDF